MFPRLREDFSCPAVEIWKDDENSFKPRRYLGDGFDIWGREEGGICWAAIQHMLVFTIPNCRAVESDNAAVDDSQDAAVLVASSNSTVRSGLSYCDDHCPFFQGKICARYPSA
jgi:hypothetical protein